MSEQTVDPGPLSNVTSDEIMSVFQSTEAPQGAEPAKPTPAPAVPTPAKPDAAKPAVTPEPAKPAVAQPTPTPEAQALAPALAAPVAAPVQSSPEDIQALRTELANVKGQLEGMTRAPGAPQPAPAADPLEALPPHGYQFNIPDQLQAAMNSDDPAQQKMALGAFAQAVAISTHKSVMQAMRKYLDGDALSRVQQMIQSSRISEQVYRDFYGDNKDLDDPQLYPFVAQCAQEVILQMKPTSWTPALRQAIEGRVRTLLNRPRQGAAPVVPAVPVTPPPAMLGGSPARGGVPRRMSVEEDIMSTLNAGFQ